MIIQYGIFFKRGTTRLVKSVVLKNFMKKQTL